ncbi:MAG: hypothetical protein JXA57_14880 [Armatimonadetes bacterium]|nr:hypothetical protein [Armatimonadota bacterium]
MDRIRNTEVGWSPAQGSYEEAVLSWQEQIDQSFRRRYLESQRTGSESQVRSEATIRSTSAVAD